MRTQRDWFVLPPSGDTYAYPGEMNTSDQDTFVNRTEHDAWLMNTSSLVAWEIATTWPQAISNYFPKYGPGKRIRACFTVNVPFMLPILLLNGDEHFKVLESGVVLFSPREWRGVGAATYPLSKKTMLSAQELADGGFASA